MPQPYQDFPPDVRRLTPRTTALTASGNASSSLQGVNTTGLPDGAVCFAQDVGKDYRFRKEATTTPVGDAVIQPSAGPGRWFLVNDGGIVMTGSDETPLEDETLIALDIADDGPFLYPREQDELLDPVRVLLPNFVPGNVLEAEATFSFEFTDTDAEAEFRGFEVTMRFVIDRGNGGFELISGNATSVKVDNQFQADGGIGGASVEISGSVRAAIPIVPGGDVTVYVLMETVTKGGTFTTLEQIFGSSVNKNTLCLRATELDVGSVSQVAPHTFSVIVPGPPPFTTFP